VGQLYEELGKIHFEPFRHERCPFEMVNVEGREKQGKAIFPTKADAETFAKYHEAENGPQEAYHCPHLDHWHLTTARLIAAIAPVKVIAPVAAGGSTLAPIVPKESPIVPTISASIITIAPTIPAKLNGWPLPKEDTRAYIVVQMTKLKGNEKTIREIAFECGVTQSYVSTLKTKYGLSCKAGNPDIRRRRTSTQITAETTYLAQFAERERQIKEEERGLVQRKQALEQEKLAASMPHIEVDSHGAIFTLYGLARELDQAQCRVLLNEVSKLARFK
jgi:hypothetical protein